MSRRSSRRIGHTLWALTVLLLSGSVGCWEQWSDSWFPQMKRQKAVQAFEEVSPEKVAPFGVPEGAVPVHPGEPPHDPLDETAANAQVNPRTLTLESLDNGKKQFERFCAACHGKGGLGDGTVSMTGPLQGPLAGVLPLAGPASIAKIRSDGHIFATIRYGRRRMPSYQRIASDDRWDIVNYIRYMNGQKGIGQ